MNYLGSKLSLSNTIISIIDRSVGIDKSTTFAELFAGTGIISRKIKNKCKKIICNDVEHYSYVLIRNYIGNNNLIPESNKIIRYLNKIDGVEGFIYNNYCPTKSDRMYFTDENGKKIDAIRQEIDKLYNSGHIDEDCFFFLLCSLLESVDRIPNTASVYAAYLKKFKKSAISPLIIKPSIPIESDNNNEVFNEDVFDIIDNINGDILYLDPPYNHRQYSSNYHLLNTICKYDNFIPRGKTGLRNDMFKSQFCGKRTVFKSMDLLLNKSDFKDIFISYNNEGILSIDDIISISSKVGKVIMNEIPYKTYKSDSKRKNKSTKTTEYLIHIKKG